MSIINFLFGTRSSGGFIVFGLVVFNADLTIDEQHERVATPTDHPVETGSTISDHVILSPERVTLQGFVTDTPVGGGFLASFPGRVQAAFTVLDLAWRLRQPVVVITGRKTYTNMIITRLSLPRNSPASMRFTVELQNIKVVSTAESDLPEAEAGTGTPSTNPADVQGGEGSPTADLASPELDAGRQTVEEPAEASRVRKETQSVASQFADLF
ncbi:MAG: hypothetical protein FKY71_08325 [Spiribacter salinus]|uniref:Dit-like phage tail protein N-terminal domain-containing protein n=1 Tax=Spiribacter salinus TaxID=1335746 RepID=A0A540VRY7_9GAMM|nr:MAG: hypothetical protein FKY71_08325 [Spiribacter salinus]